MPFIGFEPLSPREKPCICPEHYPPIRVTLEPGQHLWRCPSCGEVTKIFVPETPTNYVVDDNTPGFG